MFSLITSHLFLLASTCSKPIGPGGPALYAQSLCSGAEVNIKGAYDILTIIADIIAILIYLAGALGVIFLIVGGLFYVFSAGDPSRLKRAKEIITNAIVGLVVIFIAYAVVTFIAKSL